MIKPATPPLFVVVKPLESGDVYFSGNRRWVGNAQQAARMTEESAHRCASKLAARVPGEYTVVPVESA